jgi:hypothetical protein
MQMAREEHDRDQSTCNIVGAFEYLSQQFSAQFNGGRNLEAV